MRGLRTVHRKPARRLNPPRANKGFAILLFSYLVVFFLISMTTTIMTRGTLETTAARVNLGLTQAFWGAESAVDETIATLRATSEPPQMTVGDCQKDFVSVTLPPGTAGSTELCLQGTEEGNTWTRSQLMVEATGVAGGLRSDLGTVTKHMIWGGVFKHAVYTVGEMKLARVVTGVFDQGSLSVLGALGSTGDGTGGDVATAAGPGIDVDNGYYVSATDGTIIGGDVYVKVPPDTTPDAAVLVEAGSEVLGAILGLEKVTVLPDEDQLVPSRTDKLGGDIDGGSGDVANLPPLNN